MSELLPYLCLGLAMILTNIGLISLSLRVSRLEEEENT